MAWFKHGTKFTINTSGGSTGLTQVRDAWATWELDSNVHWQIASYQSTAPAYLVLKRKNGAAGRIMFTGGSTIHANYAGYSETTNVNNVYMVYDFTATSDTPSANYNTGTAALFGTPSDIRGRFRAPPNGLGSYTFTLYCNDTADIVFMWAGNGGTQATGYAWGKMFTADNGTTPECYASLGWVTINSYQGLSPCMQSYANSYTNNLASTQHLWVHDPAANEGTTTAVHVVLNANQLSSSGMPFGGQASYTNGEAHFKLPNGVRRFFPVLGGVQSTNAMARPSFIALQSRYWGFGAAGVLDTVWTDNNAVVQGYYLGHHNTASSEGSLLSVLNNTF